MVSPATAAELSREHGAPVRCPAETPACHRQCEATSFPTSYRCSAYVTLKSSIVWLKSDFLFLKEASASSAKTSR